MSANALAAAGNAELVVVKDRKDRKVSPTTDIRKVKAKVLPEGVRIAVRVRRGSARTKRLSYVTIRSRPGGKRYYASGARRRRPARAHERVPAQIRRKGNELEFSVALAKIGAPNRIRFRVVSGRGRGRDRAPERRSATLSTGCMHPNPCPGDWPAGVEGPFELAEVRNVRIEMSDGVKLEAWIGMPDLPKGVRAPVALTVSPYFYSCSAAAQICPGHPDEPGFWEDPPHSGPLDLAEGTFMMGVPPRRLIRAGYAVGLVSLRGTGHSGGCYSDLSALQQRDVHEIVEWFGARDWSNGRVGMLGLSYMAQTAAEALVGGSESLKTAVMTGLVTDLYTWYATPQGAFNQLVGSIGPITFAEISVWPDPFAPERAPGRFALLPERACSSFVLDETAGPMTASDAEDRGATFGPERNLIPRFDEVTASVLVLHGFQDVRGHAWQEDLVWEALTRAPKRQVEGQWAHEWPTEVYWEQAREGEDGPKPPPWWGHNFDQLMMDWLEYWLKGVGERPKDLGKVDYQDDAGKWRRAAAWPPPNARPEALFLADESLAAKGRPGSRSYSTRDNPLDYLRAGPGGAQYLEDPLGAPPFGAWSALCPEAPSSAGGTGVAYLTKPLDRAATIAGNPFAMLEVVSDRRSGTLDVRLFDVGPDHECDQWGQPLDVRQLVAGAADLRFHAGNMVARDFPVGEPVRIRVDFPSLAARLEAGHRLALVASNGYGSIVYRSGNRYPTLELVAGGGANASRLVVPVVSGSLGNRERGDSPPRPFGPGWNYE